MKELNERHKKKVAEQTDEMLNDDFERQVVVERLAANKDAVRELCALLGIKPPSSEEPNTPKTD